MLRHTRLYDIILLTMAQQSLAPLEGHDDTIRNIMGSADDPILYRLLSTMSINQLRFIAQRLTTKSNKDAALAIGMEARSWSNWSNMDDINKAIMLLQTNQIFLAQYMLQQQGASILSAMIDMFYDTEDISLRLKIGRDLLNRLGMVPPTRKESVSFTKQIIEHRHPSELTDAQLHSIANTVVDGDFEDADSAR